MRAAIRGLLLLGAMAAAGPAAATPPDGDPAIMRPNQTPLLRDQMGGGATGAPVPGTLAAIDFMKKLGQVAAFEAKMQEPAGGADEGGIHEVEKDSGDLKAFAIIQSDNTQEAIWTWSRWRRLAKDTKYDGNVDLAWKYLAGRPGWLEELGMTEPKGYYRTYNCAWGVLAALEYQAATGKTDHVDYGAGCASYLRDNAFSPPSTMYAGVLGWAVAALYRWGVETKDMAARTAALTQAQMVKTWLDDDPARMHQAEWAITGGAAFYGVVATLFTEDPAGAAAWVKKMTPEVGGFVADGPKVPDWREWWNAWSNWNMLAIHTAARYDAALAPGHLDVLGKLVDQDADDDGGIPGSPNRPAGEDQSWITNYLGFMGLVAAIEGTGPAPESGGERTDAGGGGTSGDGGGGSGGSGGRGGSVGSSGGGGCVCNVGGPAPAVFGLPGPMGLLVLAARARRRRR